MPKSHVDCFGPTIFYQNCDVGSRDALSDASVSSMNVWRFYERWLMLRIEIPMDQQIRN